MILRALGWGATGVLGNYLMDPGPSPEFLERLYQGGQAMGDAARRI